jgi:hypothetical protein
MIDDFYVHIEYPHGQIGNMIGYCAYCMHYYMYVDTDCRLFRARSPITKKQLYDAIAAEYLSRAQYAIILAYERASATARVVTLLTHKLLVFDNYVGINFPIHKLIDLYDHEFFVGKTIFRAQYK